ncbi:MAG: hypothetical protein VKK42_07100 [Lyngbya sp.]|nr:hypothetical protein [Lyngbya sp.]
MEPIELCILLLAIAISDEILNGHFKLSQRLLSWLDKKLDKQQHQQNIEKPND